MVLPIVLQAKNSTREMLFSQQFWIGLPLYLTKKYMCKKYNQFPSEFVCSIGCLISQSPTPKKMNPYTTPEMNVSLHSTNIDFFVKLPGLPKALTSLRLSSSPPLSIWTMTNLPDIAGPGMFISYWYIFHSIF